MSALPGTSGATDSRALNRAAISTAARMVPLCLAMLLASLNTSIANAVLPTLSAAFRASFQHAQWIVVAYLLSVTVLVVVVGRVGDLIGRRRVMLIGIAVFAAASVACGFASDIAVLIGARAAQGIGAAIMMSLAVAFASDVFPKEETGRAVGLLGTMSAVGTALGPTAGGLLISGIGWRAVFLVSVPVAVAALILAQRLLPTDPKRSVEGRVPFDYAGMAILAVSLGAYAASMTIHRGQFGPLSVAIIVAALAGLVVFYVVESRAEAPLVPISMLHDRLMRLGLGSSVIVSAVMMSTLVVGPFYLSKVLALNPLYIGLALSIGPVIVALIGVPAGQLADRFGTTRMTAAGLAGLALGSLALATSSSAHGLLGYVIPIIMTSAGYAVFQTANNTLIMSSAAADRRGVVGGLLNLSRNLGLITGASALGALFALVSGMTDPSRALPSSIVLGMRVTFALAAALVSVVLVAQLLQRRA